MHTRHNILLAAAMLVCASASASAQAVSVAERKFEVGAQFTALGVEDGSAVKGLGGRVAYNLNENFAIDGEVSFFPDDTLGNNQSGQFLQGLVGVRAGKRFEHVGVFAKARPGAMSLGNVTTGFDCDEGGTFTTCRPEHGAFALDLGAVVEFYPTRRAIIRADAGDTMLRFKRVTGGFLGNPVQTSGEFIHNLQLSVGFGYRF